MKMNITNNCNRKSYSFQLIIPVLVGILSAVMVLWTRNAGMLTYLTALVILISAYIACMSINTPSKILENGWRLDFQGIVNVAVLVVFTGINPN